MRIALSLIALAIIAGTVVTVQAQSNPPKSTGVESPAPSSETLKIALPGLGGTGCSATSDDPLLTAYLTHLAKRLAKPVLICSAKDPAVAAELLVSGQVDIALLDPASFLPQKAKLRAILAPRFDAVTGRVLSIALTLKASQRGSLAKLNGSRPIFIGSSAASRAVPLQALKDHGVNTKSFGPELVTTEASGIATLKAGRGDVLILTAGAGQRMCREADPQKGICPDLKEIWRGRPTARQAFVVRNDMSDADRYQLIGIHIALHKDAPNVFGFLSNRLPGAISLDPTEPTALLSGTR